MHLTDFYLPGNYDNPLTPSGRGRTIAAFYLAQGDVDTLGPEDMRRDVLNSLMSTSAVGYWLNDKGWLEKAQKIGRVQLVRLTVEGLRTCSNSMAGGSHVPTTPELVATWRRDMVNGKPGFQQKRFPSLSYT